MEVAKTEEEVFAPKQEDFDQELEVFDPKQGLEVELTGGRKVFIKYGRHADVSRATMMCDGDVSKLTSYLMMLLITIDGNKITVEDLDDLGVKDSFILTGAFSKVNF